MNPANPKHVKRVRRTRGGERLGADYFRLRDFEYVQPLYDLSFLLEIDALAKGKEVPKYRTFSLWRAAYSLDGYGTTIDHWLDGTAQNSDLDYAPSQRIRQYLDEIQRNGSLAELRSYSGEEIDRCLRLRSVRGLGPSKIALAVGSPSFEHWLSQASIAGVDHKRSAGAYTGTTSGPWQSAHVIPPLLRLLHATERSHGKALCWGISGIEDPFLPVSDQILLRTDLEWDLALEAIGKALEREKHFHPNRQSHGNSLSIKHQLGWSFSIQATNDRNGLRQISEIADSLDPLASTSTREVFSDLHLHTVWSDGNASVSDMAAAVAASGLKYFAVTDHSRTSKLQGGLTPSLWLRQANALTLADPVCPVLHGIEVDILKDGELDLPHSLLASADLVVASVHSSWADDPRTNTDRLLRAIETGSVDIIAHPTSSIVGKPGVPNYYRAPADLYWDEVFDRCAQWGVALELNCFPSRLDLPLKLLRRAIAAGCPISIGSDAHARSHLLNLRFGEAALRLCKAPVVLNRFSYKEIKEWIVSSRARRKPLPKSRAAFVQEELRFGSRTQAYKPIFKARVQPPRAIPEGSRVIGIDLTAGDKATGIALLDGRIVETQSLFTDEEIIEYVREVEPKVVSIDSPLGLPGGGESISPEAGIMRVAEHDLASIGIPAYPALIDSMRNLTLRGIGLRRAIESLPNPPIVIESYPGAAQDILCIPRKQRGLSLLREGLCRLGLKGPGLETRFHDEMDAITSAIVGRYYETGQFEAMGIPAEAQLIVPKVRPLEFDENLVICLSGKTGAGKSVIARYLSVYYGFHWIRTRDVIRDLLIEDIKQPHGKKLFQLPVDPNNVTESNLREFGAVILDKHCQVPLRERLTKIIKLNNHPIVVDSIRDVIDVNAKVIPKRPVIIWHVECSDAVIRQRVTNSKKLGETRLRSENPADHKTEFVRDHSNSTIPNNGSLEELRWSVDDALFAMLDVRRL